jgi:hypothetical protein
VLDEFESCDIPVPFTVGMVMVARGEWKASPFSPLAEITPVTRFMVKESWEYIVGN